MNHAYFKTIHNKVRNELDFSKIKNDANLRLGMEGNYTYSYAMSHSEIDLDIQSKSKRPNKMHTILPTQKHQKYVN